MPGAEDGLDLPGEGAEVLLDRNLRDPRMDPIGDARVLATWVEGLEVFALPI